MSSKGSREILPTKATLRTSSTSRSRPGSSTLRGSTSSFTAGEKEIIQGICHNKFFGECHDNSGPKRGQFSILASRRCSPEVPAPERKPFRDVLPKIHVTPIVPRLWPNDDFTAGILNIVREVQVCHLARSVCSGMSVTKFDIQASVRPPSVEKTSLPVTNLTLQPHSNDSSISQLSVKPMWPYPKTEKRQRMKAPTVKNKKPKNAFSTCKRHIVSSKEPSIYPFRKGMTKTRRVIEVSGKDGGRLRRKLYLDVFLPTAEMTTEDGGERIWDEEGDGTYIGDNGGGENNEIVNIDNNEVEYTD